MSEVTTATQDAASFFVYFAHSACTPCGVCYMAPYLLHTSDHVYNFIAARHGSLGEAKDDASTEAEDVVLVFRLHLLMAILEVSLLQTRLRLDIMRHTQVTVMLLAYVCGTQSIVHQEINVTDV